MRGGLTLVGLTVPMMPIAELVAVASSIDERHRCALGDAAAALWGCSRALYIRSSASHVFVATPSAGSRRVVLRLRPASDPDAASVLDRSARAAEALSRAGAPVAVSVRSVRGHLVEEVDGYLVTALHAVEGDPVDGDDIDAARARRWGWLLADLHERARYVRLDRVPATPDVGLPRDPGAYGLLHGDPELDNLVWDSRPAHSQGVFVDLDDVRHGWFVGDVGFALRDWASTATAAPDLAAPVPAAFVAGYRQRRPLSDEELSWLPLFARASAAETLSRLEPVIAAPAESGWPEWAIALDRRVRERAEQLVRLLSSP